MEQFSPYMNTTLAGLFSCFLVLYFLYSRQKTKKQISPPEAGGAWPLLGHLHLLGGSELPHVALATLADKYGPAFSIRLGVHRALVVSNLELARELFTTHDIAISTRPKSLAIKHMAYDGVMFGFAPYGAYWREMRKITSMELLSTRRLEIHKQILASETENSIKELYNLWNGKKNIEIFQGRVLVEMKQWFADLNLNLIVRMVAGKRYFGNIEENGEEKIEARRCQKVMREFFHYTGFFLIADNLPYLRWLDLGGYEKNMKRAATEMDHILEKWLDEHRQKEKSGEISSGEQDFMDGMLSLVEGFDHSGYNADTIIKSTCLNLILAGSDTTTIMATWVLALLMNNNHVMKRAQEELDAQVGKERLVNESDIRNLNYLQAIVKETLRLYPAGRLGGVREFTEDCNVGDYFVPKGTRLIVNLWKLQRDPKTWPDPLEFRPERFLTTHKNVEVKGQNFELIPFGSGRRRCSGTVLALQMLHFVVANLLHAFDFSLLGDQPTDMTESPGMTNAKATPLEVLIAPRLPLGLY